MSFVKSALSYIKRNFLYLLIYAVIPTIFVGVILHPFALFEFLVKYPSLVVTNLGSLLSIMFNFNIWHILLSILGIIIICAFASMVLGQIENHMRSGKVNIKNSISNLNNNLIVTSVNILILTVILLVLEFVFCSLLCLFHLIICGLNSSPNVASIIIAVILASAMFVLFMQIAGMFMLNIPNMTINGYPAKQAISNSIKMLDKKNLKFLLSLFLPFVVIIPLVCLLKGNLVIIANCIGVFILFMYVPSLVYTTYFELSNSPRYDNRKYYNY